MTWDYYDIKKEEETLTSSNTITDSRSADSYLSMRTRLNKAFDAIWTRAYYEYRSGYQCYSTPEEMKAIQERNANYSIVDPWHDSIEDFVENSTLSMIEYSRLYELLDLDASRRKNLDSIRIRQIMESLGWHYDRRRIEGDQKRGFFKTK